MESKEKVEIINLAIQKLIEERKNNEDASAEDDDQFLLSKLLSQLDSLEGDAVLKQSGGKTGLEEATSSAAGIETKDENTGQVGGDGAEISREEIVNELRHVKRQNLITHCLLSVMIVLTVAWQLSEVKLILKVKDGLNHPFRSVGSVLTEIFKRPGNNGQDAEEHSQTEAHPRTPLKMPELPLMDLPELGLNGEKQSHHF